MKNIVNKFRNEFILFSTKQPITFTYLFSLQPIIMLSNSEGVECPIGT